MCKASYFENEAIEKMIYPYELWTCNSSFLMAKAISKYMTKMPM